MTLPVSAPASDVMSKLGAASITNPPDFSLVLGGPLYQLLRRARLSDDALSLTHKRIVVLCSIAWLPLLVLSLLDGQALGGGATIPFLFDIDVHVRFLVAMPLLIAAELVVHRRMRAVAKVFLDRHLIPDADRPRFDAAFASAMRLRNSVFAEVLLIVLVYAVGILVVWRHYTALDAATWYATSSAGGSKASLAGIWYGYVSLPIFQFLLCRWYFRLIIWIRFVWQVSRIQLRLVATHPDRVGGLGISRRHGRGVHAARRRARRTPVGTARQSHSVSRRDTARFQDDDRARGRVSGIAGDQPPADFRAPVDAGEARGPA